MINVFNVFNVSYAQRPVLAPEPLNFDALPDHVKVCVWVYVYVCVCVCVCLYPHMYAPLNFDALPDHVKVYVCIYKVGMYQ